MTEGLILAFLLASVFVGWRIASWRRSVVRVARERAMMQEVERQRRMIGVPSEMACPFCSGVVLWFGGSLFTCSVCGAETPPGGGTN